LVVSDQKNFENTARPIQTRRSAHWVWGGIKKDAKSGEAAISHIAARREKATLTPNTTPLKGGGGADVVRKKHVTTQKKGLRRKMQRTQQPGGGLGEKTEEVDLGSVPHVIPTKAWYITSSREYAKSKMKTRTAV